MTTDAQAADTGVLSIEEAVNQLNAPPEQTGGETPKDEGDAAGAAEHVETPENENEIPEGEPTPEGEAEPEGATGDEDEAEQEDPDAEGEQPEQNPAEPPRFWDAKEKEAFSKLPRALQDTILKHETQRTAATSKALEQAAAQRKTADQEIARVTQLTGTLDKLLPQAVETFKGRWDGVDWNKVVDEVGADQAIKLKNQMESEHQQIQHLAAAKGEADRVAYAEFVKAEIAKLPEMCPDLADAKDGPARRKALGEFLISNNIPASSIRNMTALETAIAYDAFRWRQAEANAKKNAAQPRPKQPAAPNARPAARPSSSASGGNPQSARLKALSGKASLSIDEAVELANLREARRR